jgi:hypothetical protein
MPRESGIAPGGDFRPGFRPVVCRIDGMARLVHDCGSRAPEAAGIRVAVFFVCLAGLLGCRLGVGTTDRNSTTTSPPWPYSPPPRPPPPPHNPPPHNPPPPPTPGHLLRWVAPWRRCACLGAKIRVLAVGALASTTCNNLIADLLFLSEVSHSFLVAAPPPAHTPIWGNRPALRGVDRT